MMLVYSTLSFLGSWFVFRDHHYCSVQQTELACHPCQHDHFPAGKLKHKIEKYEKDLLELFVFQSLSPVGQLSYCGRYRIDI